MNIALMEKICPSESNDSRLQIALERPRPHELQSAMRKGMCRAISGDHGVLITGFWSAAHLLAKYALTLEDQNIALEQENKELRARLAGV
jgi:hypothetical protein